MQTQQRILMLAIIFTSAAHTQNYAMQDSSSSRFKKDDNVQFTLLSKDKKIQFKEDILSWRTDLPHVTMRLQALDVNSKLEHRIAQQKLIQAQLAEIENKARDRDQFLQIAANIADDIRTIKEVYVKQAASKIKGLDLD